PGAAPGRWSVRLLCREGTPLQEGVLAPAGFPLDACRRLSEPERRLDLPGRRVCAEGEASLAVRRLRPLHVRRARSTIVHHLAHLLSLVARSAATILSPAGPDLGGRPGVRRQVS